MANGAPGTNRTGWSQAHVDLGALSERVSSNERQFQGLSSQVGELQRDTASQFGSLRESIGAQFREIAARNEAQFAAFTASRETNWPAFWGTLIAGVVAIVALGGAILSPMIGDLNKVTENLRDLEKSAVTKDDFSKSIDLQQRRNLAMDASIKDVEKDVTDARLALATLAGTSSERHEEYLRDHAALATRIDSVDGALIKRPEIEALNKGLGDQIIAGSSSANERINSVILSLNELRHDVGANYTLGDGLKSALDRIDRMQQEINLLARTPGREAVPVPVGPPR